MIDRLERLLNLVIALRETRVPMTLEEIRERVAGYGHGKPESTRRTFERDKADLRALGVPVETAPVDRWGDRMGYRIDPRRYDLPRLDLAPEELAALALALDATGLGDEARAGLRKLEVDAGEPGGLPAADVPMAVHLAAPHLDTLLAAQSRRAPVRFGYRPVGRAAAERTVDPHALVHRGGRWYLVGRDHDRDAERAFRLDRIVADVDVVGPPGAFDEPPEVSVDAVVPDPPADGPRMVTVAVSPGVAWQVARRARGGGRAAASPPGWTEFDIAVADEARFLGWVLELGPDAVVLAPDVLRRRLVAVLEQLRDGGTAA